HFIEYLILVKLSQYYFVRINTILIMKKSFTTFVLASIMASSATAQNLEFVRSIPIPGVRSNTRQIKKTSDNNFITVGTTTRLNNVGQNQTDISITKINPDGDTLWVKFLD